MDQESKPATQRGTAHVHRGATASTTSFDGQFEPADGYPAIQNQCSTNHHDQTVLDLSVQTEAGLVIPCAGLAILDYSEEFAPPCIEVNIFGIPNPLYRELFSQHVDLYERQFS